MNFRKNVEDILSCLCIKKAEFARMAGMKNSQVSGVLGNNSPTLNMVNRFAKALNVNPVYFIYGIDDRCNILPFDYPINFSVLFRAYMEERCWNQQDVCWIMGWDNRQRLNNILRKNSCTARTMMKIVRKTNMPLMEMLT